MNFGAVSYLASYVPNDTTV